MTDAERREIVDRYTRGQGIKFIAFATEHSHVSVRKVLIEAGVEIKRSHQRNRSWGYRGGYAS